MKKIFFLSVLLMGVLISNAQSPVGKWKMVEGYTETASGKKDDFYKTMIKEEPCLATSIFVLSANGKIGTEGTTCPDLDDNAPNSIGTRWEYKKNPDDITIHTDDPDIDPKTYRCTFNGTSMAWSMKFPSSGDADDVVKLYFRFEKVK